MRLSFVVFVITFFTFIGTSIFWNISEKNFLYYENERIYYRVLDAPPKPTKKLEGHEWRRGSMVRNGEWGWKFYNIECEISGEKKARELWKRMLGSLDNYNPQPSNVCVVKFVQDQKKYKQVLKESFSKYVENELFQINLIIMLISFTGILGLLNFIAKHVDMIVRRVVSFIMG